MKGIHFIDVNFGYKKNELLFKNFSFEFTNPFTDKGYIYALMGSSGSGKSTMLKLILETVKPHSGKLKLYPDNPVVSYLPQEAILFEHLSPLENAMFFKNTSNLKKHFDNNLFLQLVEALDMHTTLKQSKSIDELSGGQRQRISLIRALSIRPNIILLDEPTNGLDSEIKLQFLHQLREIIIKHNLLAIYITHNKIEAEIIGDAIAYLYFDIQNNNRKVYSNDILSFIKKPPILEARKIFQYPISNILKVHFENNELKFFNSDKFETFYLSIEEKNIEFSQTHGFDFETEGTNSIYTRIIFSDGQQLLINNKKLLQSSEQISSYRINFTGDFLRYNSSKRYEDSIKLQNNKIVD